MADSKISLSEKYNLEDLELSLQNSLSPVRPDPQFIQSLQKRLVESPIILFEKHPLPKIYLIFAFGLFLGSFAFWIVKLLSKRKTNPANTTIQTANLFL